MSKPTAAKEFKDSGTEKHFYAGKEVDATEGEIANYRAAGLLKDEAAAKPKG